MPAPVASSDYTGDVTNPTIGGPPSPGAKPKRRVPLVVSLQVSGFTVTVLALVVLGVVVLAPSLTVMAEQQQQIVRLEAELDRVDQEVRTLEEQRERWNDRAYVEAQARSRLMFVYPGDITYLVIDDVESEVDAGPEPIDQGAKPNNWMSSLFASYLVAATTQAELPEHEGDDGESSPPPLPSPTVDGGTE